MFHKWGEPGGWVLICSVCQSQCKCSLSAGSRAVTEHGIEGRAHPSKPPQTPASPFPPGSLGLCRGGYRGAHPQSAHGSSFGWLWALLWKEPLSTGHCPKLLTRFHHLECVPRGLSVIYAVYCYILSRRRCWCVVAAQ